MKVNQRHSQTASGRNLVCQQCLHRFRKGPVTSYFRICYVPCVLLVPHGGMLSVKVIKLQERDSQWMFNLSERVFNSYHSTESYDAVALGHTTPD